MRGGIALVALSVLLAGCVADDTPEAPTDDATTTSPEVDGVTQPDNDATNVTLPPQILPVHWNGTLGTYVQVCDFAVTMECETYVDVKESNNDIIIESPGTTLRALRLTLTWAADTPVTQTLGFEIMVMGTCDDCNSTTIVGVEGESPLVLEASALDIPMPQEYVIHAYVYSNALFVHQPPLIVLGNVDQALTVDGSVTVEPMPAEASTP